MMSAEELERLRKLWQRVEASRPKLEGSAPLMPRKIKRPPIFGFPSQGEAVERSETDEVLFHDKKDLIHR